MAISDIDFFNEYMIKFEESESSLANRHRWKSGLVTNCFEDLLEDLKLESQV